MGDFQDKLADIHSKGPGARGIPVYKKVLKGSYATQSFLLTFAPDLKNTLRK
jgi:hypothetical protein